MLQQEDVNRRLLYIVGGLGGGGLERQLFYLLQTIDRERYRPELVVWTYRDDDIYIPHLRKLGIPLHYFSYNMPAAQKLLAFRCLIMRLRPEVVHSYSFYTNFAVWWATLCTSTIAVGSLRSNFFYEKTTSGPLLGRLSARWPRHQVCNSFSTALAINQSRGLFVPKQILVVRNAVDLQNFRMVPLSTEKRATILGVGSLLPVKRWDRVLRAALRLKKRGCDFVVKIAGTGALRKSLENQTQDFGIADCVEFLGYSDDVPKLLVDATFLVLTSDVEGCPNAVLEAMACGRPVVATDVGDISGLVEDGKTGFIVGCGDDDALLARMDTLITDRFVCRRMGEAGRAKAERDFRLDRLVTQTLAAYERAGWRNSL